MRDATKVEQHANERGRDRRHHFPGRTHRLTPRFGSDELAAIEAAAARVGVTPTGFCAEAAVAAARGTPPASLDPAKETFAELQAELFDTRVAVGRIGTNLNQAVAALNATGEAPDWLGRAVALCEQRMDRLDEVIARVVRRLR
jgi:hypothetical protein